mgnify:CR=1 FL=1
MVKEGQENKIKELMSAALRDINTLVDVNTVIGKPFTTNDGYTIIPVSKVTMAFMTGGGEYGEIKNIRGDKDFPFAGGRGAIVSLKPTGFLVEKEKGVKLISVPTDAFEKAFETAEEFIKSFKNEKKD